MQSRGLISPTKTKKILKLSSNGVHFKSFTFLCGEVIVEILNDRKAIEVVMLAKSPDTKWITQLIDNFFRLQHPGNIFITKLCYS